MTTALEFVITGIDKASQVFDGVGSHAEGMGSKLSNVAKTLGSGLAAEKVVDFGRESVDAYTEAQESADQLQFALDKFPATADTNAAALYKLNGALALKTRFDDDATASGQATLAQFGLTGQQLEEITPLLQDYAAKTGKDIPTAADDLGKAIMGQGRALKGIGLEFTDTGDAAGNFNELMTGLRSQVGGFAEEQGASAAGTSARLKNAFGELQETTGSMLVPALTSLSSAGVKVLGWMQEHPAATKAIVAVVGVLTLAYAGLSAAQTISAGISALRGTAVAGEAAATEVGTVANTGFAASMWAVSWPILAVIAAIAAVAAGVYLVIDNWDTIGPWLKGVWDGIAGWASGVWDDVTGWFSDIGDSIGDAIGKAMDFVKEAFSWSPLGFIIDHWGDITDFFSGIWDGAVNAFKNAMHFIATLWNDTLGDISFTTPDWVPFIGGKTFSMPKMPVPELASGAVLMGPTLFLGGEGGEPEAVVPLSKAKDLGFGGGRPGEMAATVVLQVDGRELLRAVRKAEIEER